MDQISTPNKLNNAKLSMNIKYLDTVVRASDTYVCNSLIQVSLNTMLGCHGVHSNGEHVPFFDSSVSLHFCTYGLYIAVECWGDAIK